MIREIMLFVLGVFAVATTTKAAVMKECSQEPPQCTMCMATWSFFRDVLEDRALAQTTADAGKACVCGYIADKSSALYKQCSDHMDQVPAKLLAFARATLGDPSVHCGYACGQSDGHELNASLPACPRTPTPSCKLDNQLCSACKASVLWTQQLVSNKGLIKLNSKYLNVYCNLATTSCQQKACRDLVETFEPMFEVSSSIVQVVGYRVCTPFCQASSETQVSDVAKQVGYFLRGVASLVEMTTRR